MNNSEKIRERYLRDALPVQLGGLAANLARIRSFSHHHEHKYVVDNLIDESKHFIEWSAPGAELGIQVDLVELQLILARWHLRLDRIWNEPSQRAKIADVAHL